MRTTTTHNSLVIERLNKRYNNTCIFENFSLDVKDGEFVSIFGPNGCGKTTLLKAISGLTTYEGTINKPQKISFITQNPEELVLPWLSVKANIIFPLKEKNLDKEQIGELNKIINETNLERYKHSYPYQLSGGFLQLVLLARSFFHKSELILMDEPFRSLDAENLKRTKESLIKLSQINNPTIILISHDLEEALSISDKVILFSDKPVQITRVIDARDKHKK